MSTYAQTDLSFPDATKGFFCSCCGGYVKIYRRSFNSNMALCLIALYRNTNGEFVKVENFLTKHGYQRCGDFSYLRHYGFIEAQKSKREDNSPRNGFYRLTGLGRLFVEAKEKAKEKFLIQNNKLLGFEGEEINIYQALGNKFDYNQLMNNNG
jgi:hypothetical protein